MIRIVTLFLFSMLAFTPRASAQDAGDAIFTPDVIHEIDMIFAEQNYWDILTANFGGGFNPDVDIPYLMASVVIDGEQIDSIGIRFKGFTSASAETKKPFKFDFNEFVKGKRYDGLRKLNLNNGTGDPGLQRDVICYDLMNKSGVDAPRASFARVSINGEFFAVYQLIEQVDKEFLKNNFSNAKGNLFKNKGWYNFEYFGTDPDDYRVLELKTNEEGDDYSGLIRLTDVLNNTDEADFPAAIEEIFNVDLYLKTLAVDVATDNWDSNLEHGRNWYMYEDTTTGIFNWIPWDYNFALGSDAFGGGGGDECFVAARPVALTLLDSTSVEFYDDGFYNRSSVVRTWDFGDSSTSQEKRPTHQYASPGTYEVCLTVSVDNGVCTETDCITVNTASNLAACPVVVNGDVSNPPDMAFAILLTFQSECCETWGEDCEEFYEIIQDNLDGNGGGGGFGNNFPVDQRDNDRLLISKLLAVPDFYNRYLGHFCDLMERVMVAGRYDELISTNRALLATAMMDSPNELFPFRAFEQDMAPEGMLAYLADRIAVLREQLDTMNACSPVLPAIPLGDIAINEFVADNDSLSGISDPDGGYPDWIELYNNTDAEIDLSDAFLSDKEDNLLKFQFPEGTTIGANDYLIIWADEDGDQQGIHANFKLSRGGEAIYLSNAIDSTRIDEVIFGEQQTNVSMSRVPNGTGDFVTQHTTHEYSNDTPVATRNVAGELAVEVYPNPAGDWLQLRFPGAAAGAKMVDVLAVDGRQALAPQPINSSAPQLDLSRLNPGFYFLRVRDAEGKTGAVKFAKW